jgi:hypothetical protein
MIASDEDTSRFRFCDRQVFEPPVNGKMAGIGRELLGSGFQEAGAGIPARAAVHKKEMKECFDS